MDWNVIWGIVSQELVKTTWIVLALFGVMLAYLFLSYINNNKFWGESFSIKWFLDGLLKNVLKIVSIYLIVVSASIVQQLPGLYGLGGDIGTAIEGVSVAAVYAVLIAGIGAYFIKVISLMKGVFFVDGVSLPVDDGEELLEDGQDLPTDDDSILVSDEEIETIHKEFDGVGKEN